MSDPNRWLSVVHAAYPDGYYYKDLSRLSFDTLSRSALASVEDPLLLRIRITDLNRVVESLILEGLPPSTACVLLGTTTVSGQLGDILLRARKFPDETADLLISEDISRLFEKPLLGKKVLVTRAVKQAAGFSELLQQSGAKVFEVPAIDIVLRKEGVLELVQAMYQIQDYSWLILTSVNTVSVLNDLLIENKLSWSIFDVLQIACIGAATAGMVKECGGRVALVPPRFQAESLAEELLKHDLEGRKILLPRAEGSRDILPKQLRGNGARVHEIHIYRAELPERSREDLKRILESEHIDFITFTSSSTVRNFVEMAGDLLPQISGQSTQIACIGPVTASTLKEYGIPAGIEADESTMQGLLRAIVKFQAELLK